MIEEQVRAAGAGDQSALEELVEIAAASPVRLSEWTGSLFDAGVLWPPSLYRAAGVEVVRRVVEVVDSGSRADELNWLLLIVAHAPGPEAEAALRRWQEHPPVGVDRLHVDALGYARTAGWVIDPDGVRRELCSPTAYQLVMEEVPLMTSNRACRLCASPLWRIADFETGDAAVREVLARTGWSGRLRIDTCYFCSCYSPLFVRVTPGGEPEWWEGNSRPSYLPDVSGPEDPPTLRPVVGQLRPSPFQASAWGKGGSTLGGFPDWIQDYEYVDCPDCGQSMDYLGLVAGADLESYGEGAYYLHLHAPCGLAAVNYQQS